eukprot:TRINITY_DN12245_c0_g1_i6.p1 TRINITY_DN12245_c0_g1~~TRINITY_DN12245_c0_g1_i6.p1  ORF type:complete len:264 (+),score=35.06 TRINITY_DN12245_c0_g1_i6:120-911(+)
MQKALELERIHRQLQTYVAIQCGRHWGLVLRDGDRNHTGAYSKHSFHNAIRKSLRVTPQMVSDADVRLLYCMLDRDRNESVDIEDLIAFLSVSTTQAVPTILQAHKEPGLRGRRLWGEQWRDQKRPQRPASAPITNAALTARRRRALAQSPAVMDAMKGFQRQLSVRCGSLQAAAGALDVFKQRRHDGRRGMIGLRDLKEFLHTTLRLPNGTALADQMFNTIDLDGEGEIAIDVLIQSPVFFLAVAEQLPTAIHSPRDPAAKG